DGKSMAGWDGTPDLWSVQDGALTGLSCPDKPSGTTFLIYTGSQPGDFDLKMDFRLELGSGNSGIQYRSTQAEPNMAGFGGGRGGSGRGPGGGRGFSGGPGGFGGRGGSGGPGGRGPGGNANAGPFSYCAGREAAPGAPAAGRGPGGGAYTHWNVQGYQ